MNFEWDPDKAREVLANHGVSFEEIVNLIGRGFLVKTMVNPSKKHRGQKVFLVRKANSIYMVPFERRHGKYRLITAFYSKYFTQKYFERDGS